MRRAATACFLFLVMTSGTPPTNARPSSAELTDAAQLQERLRRRERELAAIRRLQFALHARTQLDDLEREALNVAIEVADASGGTIYLHEPRRRSLIFKYVVGPTPEITRSLAGLEMPDDRGISGEVFHSGVGRITNRVADERSHNRDVDARTQFRTESSIAVPLKTLNGRVLGVLQVLNRRSGGFEQEDLEILEVIGAQAAIAIETARLYEDARRSSVINLVGDISHDVKNLLTPVVTGTQTLEMLLDELFADLDQALLHLPAPDCEAVLRAVGGVRDFYPEAVGMVYDGAQDIQERVREIADAIKGIISQPHYVPTDLRERAEAVAKVLRLVAERHGIRIDLTGLADTGPIEADRRAIYNALYNLVNNAIPETPEGGVIALRSRPIAFNGGSGLEIQVADTGRGMPAEVRERMFTDNAISTKPGGTGLGTRIVKNVIDVHHGTIRVESEPGRGTVFTIQLPARQPIEGRDEAPA